MKILLIAPERGTAMQRHAALRRLGHDVTAVDVFQVVEDLKLPRVLLAQVYRWIFKTGAFGLGGAVSRYISSKVRGAAFDLALVDSGELLGAESIMALKKAARVVVNYNPDNPYVSRDGLRWRLFLQALPYYDLIATLRISSAEAAKRAGARRVLLIRFAADEVVHRPIALSEEDRARFSSPVVFVGTWMPERGPFLLRLVERGVPLRIYGDRWNLAPEYGRLRERVFLGGLEGEDYVKAIRGASIAIGLLSKGNQDLHTTRSLEIPAIGTLLCAERTSDHLEMYKDGEEAVFFDTADECADLCLALLARPDRIETIAAAGLKRVWRNGDFNEKVLTKMIEAGMNAAEN